MLGVGKLHPVTQSALLCISFLLHLVLDGVPTQSLAYVMLISHMVCLFWLEGCNPPRIFSGSTSLERSGCLGWHLGRVVAACTMNLLAQSVR